MTRRKLILVRNLSILFLVGFLILGNPTEYRFMSRLQDDYGSIHHGRQLSIQQLNQIGQSTLRSYLVWSVYEYSFGTINVKYFGIGFMTFYVGSNNQPSSETNQQERPIT